MALATKPVISTMNLVRPVTEVTDLKPSYKKSWQGSLIKVRKYTITIVMAPRRMVTVDWSLPPYLLYR